MDLTEDRFFVGIGLAVPGLVGMRDGVVRTAPHLGWKDESLVANMGEATGLPVWAANDATCGVIAEAQFGAAVGLEEAVYINGGVAGIGGGIIAGGALLTGRSGYAGEIGHLLVNSQGRRCHCGKVGCLETEVSRSRLLSALGIAHADDADLHSEVVAAYGHNRELTAEVDRQMKFLSVALENLANIFDPARVILSGFLSALAVLGSHRLLDEMNAGSLRGAGEKIELVVSALPPSAILIGAAELVLQKILDDPLGIGQRW